MSTGEKFIKTAADIRRVAQASNPGSMVGVKEKSAGHAVDITAKIAAYVEENPNSQSLVFTEAELGENDAIRLQTRLLLEKHGYSCIRRPVDGVSESWEYSVSWAS